MTRQHTPLLSLARETRDPLTLNFITTYRCVAQWWRVREVVGRYLPLPSLPPGLTNSTAKGRHGRVELQFVSPLLEARAGLGAGPATAPWPQPMETLGQAAAHFRGNQTLVRGLNCLVILYRSDR